jgi:hypothetical protein
VHDDKTSVLHLGKSFTTKCNIKINEERNMLEGIKTADM